MPDTQTQLAGTTVPCPHCDGLPHIIPGMDQGRCPFCHGTGRVYLFPDEVRVLCNRLRADLAPCPEECESKLELHLHEGPGHHENPCVRCNSRGWTAVTDGWVWWRAVQEIGGRFLEEVLKEFTGAVRGGEHPNIAFFSAVEHEVVALLGTEVPDA